MKDKLRLYGNIPSLVPDDFLSLHLANAEKEIKLLAPQNTDQSLLEEAILAQALVFIFPAANTFFVEGMPSLNTENIESRFFSPSEVKEKVRFYQSRVSVLLRRIAGKKKIWSCRIIGGL